MPLFSAARHRAYDLNTKSPAEPPKGAKLETLHGGLFRATLEGPAGQPQGIAMGYGAQDSVAPATNPTGAPVRVDKFAYGAGDTTTMNAGLLFDLNLAKIKRKQEGGGETAGTPGRRYFTSERHENQVGPTVASGDWRSAMDGRWYDAGGHSVPMHSEDEIRQGNANWVHPSQQGPTLADGRWLHFDTKWRNPDGRFAQAPTSAEQAASNPNTAGGDHHGAADKAGQEEEPDVSRQLHGWTYETDTGAFNPPDYAPTSLELNLPVQPAASLSWKLTPCGSSCPSLGLLASFDASHADTVMLALPESAPGPDITWSFDGTRWTRLAPAVSPSVDPLRASMAFDAATGQIVLVGAGPAGDAETWTWDGSNWARQHPPTTPDVVNGGTSIAYDSHSTRIVLFGGQGSDRGPSGATWTWDGSTWTQVSSARGKPNGAPGPSPRVGAAMVYDPKLNGLLLFGGSAKSGSPIALGDTWLWDGVHWTLKDSGYSAGAPPPGSYDMTTDQATQTPILLGVDKNSQQWQQWAWDGSHWQRLTGGTTPQQTAPPLGELVAATYDTTRGVVQAFGPAELAFGTPAESTSQLVSVWQGIVTTGSARGLPGTAG